MLSKTLNELTEQDRQVLIVALEGGVAQLLRLDGDLCIAVNMKANPDIEILEEKGYWIYGRLTKQASGRYERRANGCGEHPIEEPGSKKDL